MKASAWIAAALAGALGFGSFLYSRCVWICDISPETRVRLDLRALSTYLDQYRAATGRLPSADEGLSVLTQPVTIHGRAHQFLPRPLTDAWNQPYHYRLAPENPRGYIVFSQGHDPRTPSDDIFPP